MKWSEVWPPSRLPLVIAALGYWPSNPIPCIYILSHWPWYSFLSSLSYHDHVHTTALTHWCIDALVLARSPHAPPRLPWSRPTPRSLRLLWSTLYPAYHSGWVTTTLPQLRWSFLRLRVVVLPLCTTNSLLPMCGLRRQAFNILVATSQMHCPGFLHHDGSPLGARRQL